MRKVGHGLRVGDGSGALMQVRPLGDTVRSMSIAVRRLRVGLRAEGLRCLDVGLCDRVGLRRHQRLVWLHGKRRHLLAWELLLEEHIPNAMLGGNVGLQPAIEVPRRRGQVRAEAQILSGEVIVFFLVHFLVQHIVLGDAQGTAGALLVDLRGTTGGLNAGLETAVAASRRGNVCAAARLAPSWTDGRKEKTRTAPGSPHGCAPSSWASWRQRCCGGRAAW